MTFPRRRSKYGNKKTEVDNITFDSKAEARRYRELRLMERAGLIRDLELQPRWALVVNDVKIGRYTGDFRYFDVVLNRIVVEDVKGFKARDVALRYKLMKACHGVDVQEVRRAR